MHCRIFVVSNNPLLAKMSFPGWEVACLDDPSLVVLQIGRDKIHTGWLLANHPLYGNVQPSQQPYRTLILKSPQSRKIFKKHTPDYYHTPIDQTSLNLIEEALIFYGHSQPLHQNDAPENLRRDSAAIDLALITATMEQAGWMSDVAGL